MKKTLIGNVLHLAGWAMGKLAMACFKAEEKYNETTPARRRWLKQRAVLAWWGLQDAASGATIWAIEVGAPLARRAAISTLICTKAALGFACESLSSLMGCVALGFCRAWEFRAALYEEARA